jgi:hypothetical protein
VKFNTKLSVCLVALGLGVVFGFSAEEEAKPQGTHTEIEPIQFGTHSSGKPITIKTIAMNRDSDLLVGISWGEGEMEFAQPRGNDGGGGRDRRFRGSGGERRPGFRGGLMQMLPVLLALDENGDGEISNGEIEKAEEALAKLDKNGDGKLTGDELRPNKGQRGRAFGGGQQDRLPVARSGSQAQDSDKSSDEIENILEFGTEEEIAELAREIDPRSFFEALRGMDSDDRRKLMGALPEEVRSRFGGRRAGRGEGGGRGGGGGDRSERRGNRGPLAIDDLFKHQYGIRVISLDGSVKAEWSMPDDGPHPKMIHACDDGTVYVAGHGKMASYDKNGKRLAMADIDKLSGEKSLAAGMFVSDKHVFLAVGMGNSMRATEDIYRFNRDFTEAKKIIEQQYGCCSHIDMQVMNGELLIAENSRHRVNRFDLDGKPLGRWGKRDRTGIEGFAACCNPVNIDIGPGNVLYTAESGIGRIKKYTPEGEYLGVVGYVDTTEFDSGSRLAAQTCYIPIEVNKDASRVYVMDVRANLIRVLAPRKK